MHNLILFLILILSACSSNQKSSKLISNNSLYQGHYKVGSPYIIENIKYHPKKDDHYVETGVASWYGGSGDGFHGKKTANGDICDKNSITAAHRTLPLPSIVKITNLKNNKSIKVMVNDRGPFSKKRIIDVSEKAASMLKMKHQGSTKVKVEYLKNDTEKFLAKMKLQEKEGAKSKVYMKEISNYMLALNKDVIPKSIQKHIADPKKKYYVQVGTYKSKNNAEKLKKELKEFGKSKIHLAQNSPSLYKLSFGPFNGNKANEMLSYLNDVGNEDIKLVASN